jgi:glutathione S-transferase
VGESRPVSQDVRGVPAERIYHLTMPGQWAAAISEGTYRLSTRDRTLEEVGFVHCGHREQVLEVAERLYADSAELVVLVIDPERLGSPVREENLEGGTELHPHIYGRLELAAVTDALPMRRQRNGRFSLPAGL